MSRQRMITYEGKTMNVKEWSAETGIPLGALRMRLAAGWTIERALSTPVPPPRERELLTHPESGRILTISQWAKLLGISRWLIVVRLGKGWPIARVLAA